MFFGTFYFHIAFSVIVSLFDAFVGYFLFRFFVIVLFLLLFVYSGDFCVTTVTTCDT